MRRPPRTAVDNHSYVSAPAGSPSRRSDGRTLSPSSPKRTAQHPLGARRPGAVRQVGRAHRARGRRLRHPRARLRGLSRGRRRAACGQRGVLAGVPAVVARANTAARRPGWRARAPSQNAMGDCVVRGYLLVPGIHRLLLARDNEAAYRDAMEAAAVGDRFGEPDLSALGRQLAGRALIERGDVAEGMSLLDEAMLIATADGLTDLGRGLVYCAVVGCCQRVFALDRAREWSTVLDAWCSSQTQLGLFNGTCRVHRAEILQLGGSWTAALDETRRVSDGKPDERERALADYEEAEIRRLRGEFDEAGRLYEAASRRGLDPQPGLSLLRLAQGDLAAAVGGIRRVTRRRSARSGARSTCRRWSRSCSLPSVTLPVEPVRHAGHARPQRSRSARRRMRRPSSARSRPPSAPRCSARSRSTHPPSLLLHGGDAATAVPTPDRGAGRVAGAGRSLPGRAHPGRARRRLRGARRRGGRPAAAGCGPPRLRGPRRCTRPGRTRRDHRARAPARAGIRPTASSARANSRCSARRRPAAPTRRSAAALGLSTRTVDRHVSNILTKLGVPSRAAATSYAYEHGLIRHESATG